ncbi:unnamed protein product [Cylindrotheca closterium]|uniref:Uncharacterized protein n=1 Tax=Cylindrotheca closterium TaxID=2856 RepID=A0AAD2CT35_9STRA|nr:unnamed protein product [Cylindrotheca closterium]
MTRKSSGLGAMMLAKLTGLDFDSPESLAMHYKVLRTGVDDKGVPKHFLGFDTDLELLGKKIKQYRKLSNDQQAAEGQRWNEMPDWEKDTFISRIEELKRKFNPQKMSQYDQPTARNISPIPTEHLAVTGPAITLDTTISRSTIY